MRFRPRRDDDIDINVTSLIDVVLLLLIFFMVSTRFVDQSRLNLTLPSSAAKPLERMPASVEIAIAHDGQVAVGGRVVSDTSVPALRRALQEAAGEQKNPLIVINADRETGFQKVIDALDAARQAGFPRVTFPTKFRNQE